MRGANCVAIYVMNEFQAKVKKSFFLFFIFIYSLHLSLNDENPKHYKIELKKEKQIQIVAASRPTQFFPRGQEGKTRC